MRGSRQDHKNFGVLGHFTQSCCVYHGVLEAERALRSRVVYFGCNRWRRIYRRGPHAVPPRIKRHFLAHDIRYDIISVVSVFDEALLGYAVEQK